ncbi:YbbR-like domain-containing protein [Ruminococcus sp.]|uniref:CdaR family protein n=1 Tax=Ruminococcus sp. TaxID=41978 RepID=UPI0038909BDA
MKNNRSVFSRFFSHDITLLVLAFLLAFVAWFVISMSEESEENKTITDIPVTIELPDTAIEDGLHLYGADDLKASVEVKGNRVMLGTLTASDIQVTANQSSSMVSVGTYTLSLTAKQNSLKTNYTIVKEKLSPSTATVYVDKEKEEEFTIDNQITVQLDDSTHYASVALSKSKVIVSGPENHVNQIASVAVVDNITGLSGDSQKTINEDLVFLDDDGEKLYLPYVKTDIGTVEATISVLPVAEVSLRVDVANAPSNYPNITIDPPTVKIAGPQDALDNIKDNKVTIGSLDFTKLKNEGNKQKFDITLPSGCKVISGETSATAYIDLNSYYSTTVAAKVTTKLDSSKYTVEFASNNAEIVINGPEDLINAISSSDVTAIADFTGLLDGADKDSAVSISAPLKISLGSDYSDCWVYGTYTVNANVTKK